jgi:hypothetical protein
MDGNERIFLMTKENGKITSSKKSPRLKASPARKPIETHEGEDKIRLDNPPVGFVDGNDGLNSGEYQHDPHLDPQLQGSSEAEHTSFEVPAVSPHVHEQIDPQQITESVGKKPDDGRNPGTRMKIANRPGGSLSNVNSAIAQHATLFEAVLTVMVIILALLLWMETQKQVHVAQNALAFQRQSDSTNAIAQKAIADSSIELSKKIAATQERFAKIETRAYVVFSQVSRFDFTVGSKMMVELEFTNAGRTPATNMRTLYRLKIGNGIYQGEIDAIEKGIDNLRYKGTLGAGMSSSLPYSMEMTMTKADSAYVFGGERAIYVIGKIAYGDIFGDSHATRFCFQFVPPGSFVPVARYSISD